MTTYDCAAACGLMLQRLQTEPALFAWHSWGCLRVRVRMGPRLDPLGRHAVLGNALAVLLTLVVVAKRG